MCQRRTRCPSQHITKHLHLFCKSVLKHYLKSISDKYCIFKYSCKQMNDSSITDCKWMRLVSPGTEQTGLISCPAICMRFVFWTFCTNYNIREKQVQVPNAHKKYFRKHRKIRNWKKSIHLWYSMIDFLALSDVVDALKEN